jgi:hypothetical protein
VNSVVCLAIEIGAGGVLVLWKVVCSVICLTFDSEIFWVILLKQNFVNSCLPSTLNFLQTFNATPEP